MDIHWSGEIPFEQHTVEREVPDSPGVYQILQSQPYCRYNGETRILKIGKSEGSLRQEIGNHFIRHAVANRLVRIRRRPGIEVSVLFATLSKELAGSTEAKLLCDFEDQYWDLPLFNSQRGYARNADRHYRR